VTISDKTKFTKLSLLVHIKTYPHQTTNGSIFLQ